MTITITVANCWKKWFYHAETEIEGCKISVTCEDWTKHRGVNTAAALLQREITRERAAVEEARGTRDDSSTYEPRMRQDYEGREAWRLNMLRMGGKLHPDARAWIPA